VAPFYVQSFEFLRGRALLVLSTFALWHPYPTASQQFLEGALVGRAEVSEALL
jgi:hypothetical protein